MDYSLHHTLSLTVFIPFLCALFFVIHEDQHSYNGTSLPQPRYFGAWPFRRGGRASAARVRPERDLGSKEEASHSPAPWSVHALPRCSALVCRLPVVPL